jgi:RNA polymerase sigma-70 factor (ECF subfamily)
MEQSDNLTDEIIVEMVRQSERELFAVIMQRYQSKLLRYARNLIKDGDKTADVVQNAFIKAYQNLNGFDTKRKFSSWMYRIVHNEAMNAVEKYKREEVLPENFDLESDESPMGDFEKKEIVEKVGDCLKQIPILYSEPLVLYFIEEKTYEEIGEILRIPMGTVAIRISRAKKIMKKICKKN